MSDDLINEDELRNELDSKLSEIKPLIDESRKISNKLSELFSKSKVIRDSKSAIVEEVKKRKSERDSAQQKVRELSSALKPLKSSREEHGEVKRPGSLKRQIEEIEWKIWTEPMAYKKEEELTKIKNELEGELKDSEEILGKYSDEKKVRKMLIDSIDSQRKLHTEVVERSHQWDALSKEYSEISKTIDSMKTRKNEIDSLITAAKTRVSEIRKILNIKEGSDRAVMEKNRKDSLKEKLEEVKKRFKETGKLSTEDLLILSTSDESLV